MSKLKATIRILIFCSFLTPFVTCSNHYVSTAVTIEDSLSLINDINKKIYLTDTAKQIIAESPHPVEAPAKNLAEESYWNKLKVKIFRPTDDSFSGLGAIILYSNLPGKIAIGCSFAISFFSLFSWQFLRVKNRRIYLTALNLITVITFIVDCLITKDNNLLWGIWLLTGLIILLLFLEFKELPKASASSSQTRSNSS